MPLPSSGGIAETQILTLNGDFGAYLVPEGTGVVLNNSLPDFSNRVRPLLDSRKLYEAMGHKMVEFKGLFGPAMCICIDHEKKLLFGAADPRSADGLAAGF